MRSPAYSAKECTKITGWIDGRSWQFPGDSREIGKVTSMTALDETNRRLLRELHANPRITMSALGRLVGMSAPAVTERVQRMERDGVITGYHLDVDPAALGLPVSAFTRVRPAPREKEIGRAHV